MPVALPLHRFELTFFCDTQLAEFEAKCKAMEDETDREYMARVGKKSAGEGGNPATE